jgi:hypothetical protein
MSNVPELPRKCGSWVIVRKSDGESVCETFSRKFAEAVNQERYDVLTAADYLGRLNKKIREES